MDDEKKEKKIILAKVIQKVKNNKLGVTDDIILEYINHFEAEVQMEVLNKKADDLHVYNLEDDQKTELIIPFPFYDAYELYCEAMIDYENREFTSYNNVLAMFKSKYNSYKNYVMNKDSGFKDGYTKYIQ